MGWVLSVHRVSAIVRGWFLLHQSLKSSGEPYVKQQLNSTNEPPSIPVQASVLLWGDLLGACVRLAPKPDSGVNNQGIKITRPNME